MIKLHDVVQFTDAHKWCGCLGIVEDVGKFDGKTRYLVGVPIPERGTAYITCMDFENVIEIIGHAVITPVEDEADD